MFLEDVPPQNGQSAALPTNGTIAEMATVIAGAKKDFRIVLSSAVRLYRNIIYVDFVQTLRRKAKNAW
jgi:hypothetical protein